MDILSTSCVHYTQVSITIKTKSYFNFKLFHLDIAAKEVTMQPIILAFVIIVHILTMNVNKWNILWYYTVPLPTNNNTN